jgi:hypothetical protein
MTPEDQARARAAVQQATGIAPPVWTSLKRDVYTALIGIGVGAPQEMLPDMTLNVVDPESIGLQVVVNDGAVQRQIVFLLDSEAKSQLLKLLSGGVEIARDLSVLRGNGEAPR